MKDKDKLLLLHVGNIYSYWVTKYKIPFRRASLKEVVEYCKKNNLNILTLKKL